LKYLLKASQELDSRFDVENINDCAISRVSLDSLVGWPSWVVAEIRVMTLIVGLFMQQSNGFKCRIFHLSD